MLAFASWQQGSANIQCWPTPIIFQSVFMSFPILAPDGSRSAPSYSWTSEPTSGLYRDGAGNHRYSVLDFDVLVLDGNGTPTDIPLYIATENATGGGPGFGVGIPDDGSTPFGPLDVRTTQAAMANFFFSELTSGNSASFAFTDAAGNGHGSFGLLKTGANTSFFIEWNVGGVSKSVSFSSNGTIATTAGDLTLQASTNRVVLPATQKLVIPTGANARAGTATLVAGTVTINNTSVTANSLIFITKTASGGASGIMRVSAIVAGTSFTVVSASGTDTSSFNWLIVEGA